MRNVTLALGATLLAPTLLSAQATPADWSRVTMPPSCYPVDSCGVRLGLAWDTTNAIPVYPSIMRAVGIMGMVVVHFEVTDSGTVDPGSIAVVSSTNRAFEVPVSEAIRQWKLPSAAPERPAGKIPIDFTVRFALATNCRKGPTPASSGFTGTWTHLELVVIAPCRALVPRNQVHPFKKG